MQLYAVTAATLLQLRLFIYHNFNYVTISTVKIVNFNISKFQLYVTIATICHKCDCPNCDILCITISTMCNNCDFVTIPNFNIWKFQLYVTIMTLSQLQLSRLWPFIYHNFNYMWQLQLYTVTTATLSQLRLFMSQFQLYVTTATVTVAIFNISQFQLCNNCDFVTVANFNKLWLCNNYFIFYNCNFLYFTSAT